MGRDGNSHASPPSTRLTSIGASQPQTIQTFICVSPDERRAHVACWASRKLSEGRSTLGANFASDNTAGAHPAILAAMAAANEGNEASTARTGRAASDRGAVGPVSGPRSRCFPVATGGRRNALPSSPSSRRPGAPSSAWKATISTSTNAARRVLQRRREAGDGRGRQAAHARRSGRRCCHPRGVVHHVQPGRSRSPGDRMRPRLCAARGGGDPRRRRTRRG